MLSEKDRNVFENRFKDLSDPVTLAVFTQETECNFCKETRLLIEELGTLSSKLKVQVFDLVKDEKVARQYSINKIPAVAIIGKKDYGIRFFGVPAGYEFKVLIDDIMDVSRGRTDLPEAVKKKLEQVKKPVHIQVFVSLTCPYCPVSVRTAHQFAIENENIRSDMVESSIFAYLSQRYSVMGVPKVIINEDTSFIGAQPPEFFADQVIHALKSGYNPMYS